MLHQRAAGSMGCATPRRPSSVATQALDAAAVAQPVLEHVRFVAAAHNTFYNAAHCAWSSSLRELPAELLLPVGGGGSIEAYAELAACLASPPEPPEEDPRKHAGSAAVRCLAGETRAPISQLLRASRTARDRQRRWGKSNREGV